MGEPQEQKPEDKPDHPLGGSPGHGEGTPPGHGGENPGQGHDKPDDEETDDEPHVEHHS